MGAHALRGRNRIIAVSATLVVALSPFAASTASANGPAPPAASDAKARPKKAAAKSKRHALHPTIDWGILGGHVYNSSRVYNTYYTRNSTGRFNGETNRLKYSDGWASQSRYPLYLVRPRNFSDASHDADMMWVPARREARVNLWNMEWESGWFSIYGGPRGRWFKVPQNPIFNVMTELHIL
jgi:hypothetical protein